MGRGSELAVIELIRQLVPILAESASRLDPVGLRLRPYSANLDDRWRRVDLDRHDETSETHATSPLVAECACADRRSPGRVLPSAGGMPRRSG